MSTQPNTPQGQSNTNPCEELEALLPAYSIGATNAQETALVESLLSECPEVASELPEFVALSGAMLERVEPIAPPVGLHDKLMSALADQAENDVPVQTPPPTLSSRPDEKIITFPAYFTQIAVAVALVAVAGLIITNIYWIAEVNNVRSENDDVIAQLEEANNTQGAFITLITENVRRADLADTTTNNISASVFWNPDAGFALLYADELSPLADNVIYQLWLIDDTGTPLSIGIFDVNAQGRGTFTFNPSAPLPDFSAIAISIEPEGGSEQPTSNPIAIGEL